MQHRNLPPVIHVFMFNGQPVNVRRRVGGTYEDAAAAFVETMLHKMPLQNKGTIMLLLRIAAAGLALSLLGALLAWALVYVEKGRSDDLRKR